MGRVLEEGSGRGGSRGIAVRGLPLPFVALSKAVLQLPGGAGGGRFQRRKRKGMESMLLTAVMS